MASESLRADRLVLGRKETRSRGVSRVDRGAGPPDDLTLVREGDEAALRRVIAEYSSMVYGVAMSITACEADAEEVLQEVFIGLPEGIRSFNGDNFAGWLKVVARRRAITHVRSETRWRSHRGAAATTASFEDVTLSMIALERALATLDPALREVFVLSELRGWSHGEIASALNTTENLSQVRLHRARRALRELLTP